MIFSRLEEIVMWSDFGLDERNMKAYHTEDYTDSENRKFRIEHYYDSDMGPPWKECDGHGVVTEWEKRDKRPGELILSDDGRGGKRFYDFQESIRLARRENWNNTIMLPTPEERGKAIEDAVRADYEYLRAWCNDEWHYMGIVVFPLTTDGDELRSKEASLWAIESSSDPSYIREATESLLQEVGAELHTSNQKIGEAPIRNMEKLRHQ